jgi:hypothetical protein
MNKALATVTLYTACVLTVQAQSSADASREASKRSNGSSESREGSRTSLPNVRLPISSNSQGRKPTTVNQVERQTGGKVIGARPVNIQGRQLNQIKVQLPNGRIVIHRQLFDENGRSVDTVQQVDDEPRPRDEATDD